MIRICSKLMCVTAGWQHDEEVAKKQREEEEQRKKEAEERRMRIERGLETESEQGDDGETQVLCCSWAKFRCKMQVLCKVRQSQ